MAHSALQYTTPSSSCSITDWCLNEKVPSPSLRWCLAPVHTALDQEGEQLTSHQIQKECNPQVTQVDFLSCCRLHGPGTGLLTGSTRHPQLSYSCTFSFLLHHFILMLCFPVFGLVVFPFIVSLASQGLTRPTSFPLSWAAKSFSLCHTVILTSSQGWGRQ